MSGTTEDLFLGGRVRLRQPRGGYRAATDPVFLAAACPARPLLTICVPKPANCCSL